MPKTISTHNGSAAYRDHNIRNPKITEKQPHINPDLTPNNVILYDEKPRDAYKRLFGDAVEKYNQNQRPDKRIDDYFTKILKDKKKHPVYEMIIQIGNKDDTGVDAETEKQCLIEYYQGWAERNPHLACIGAYIHADEGTLHMHLDYVPVATGYAKGLETRTALVKALEQQGFTKNGKYTAQIRWEHRENEALQQICERHQIQVIHPQRDHVEHLDVNTYKATQDAKKAAQELAEVQQQLDRKVPLLQAAELPPALEQLPAPRKILSRVSMPQEDYRTLCRYARSGEAALVESRTAKQDLHKLQRDYINLEIEYHKSRPDDRSMMEMDLLELKGALRRADAKVEQMLREIAALAIQLLQELWHRLVRPLQEREPTVWTWPQAAAYAEAHDPEISQQIKDSAEQVAYLEERSGGPTPALEAVLTREYGRIPVEAQKAIETLPDAFEVHWRAQQKRQTKTKRKSWDIER